MDNKEGLLGRIKNYSAGCLVGVVLIGTAAGWWYEFGSDSRRTLDPRGKRMEYVLPDDFGRMINVSSGGSEGDVMLTYETKAGRFVTMEYNRKRLWETVIDWIPGEEK